MQPLVKHIRSQVEDQVKVDNDSGRIVAPLKGETLMAMNGIDIASYQAGIDPQCGPKKRFCDRKGNRGNRLREPRFHKSLRTG